MTIDGLFEPVTASATIFEPPSKKLINYVSYSNVPRKTYALLHGLNFGFQQSWRYRLFFWVMLTSAVGHWLIIQLKKIFMRKKKN